MVQKKKGKKVEQNNSGEEGGWCCLALLTSLTAVLCFWMADVLRESACVRARVCMCAQAERACSWVHFKKASRGPSGQSRSARVSSSSFSSLPGDAAELKECVRTAQFVI